MCFLPWSAGGLGCAGGNDRTDHLSESPAFSVDVVPTRRVGDLEDGTMRRMIVVALGCAAVLLAPASALAGRSDSVDPAIMQPALNPDFAPWDCWRAGGGITCEGRLSDAWTNRQWGIVACDGRPVYSTGTEERASDPPRRRRRGSPCGRTSHVAIRETLSLQPDGSGPTMRAVGTWSSTSTTATPGRHLDPDRTRHRH